MATTDKRRLTLMAGMRTEEEVENEAAVGAAATGATKTTAADMVRDAIASTESEWPNLYQSQREMAQSRACESGSCSKRENICGEGSEVGDGGCGSVVDEADGVQMAN